MFSIVDYDTRYSPYDKSGGALKNADWVKLPAKPKGEGLGELLEYKRGLEVFGIWCLLLEKTTNEKPENRGKLLNHKEQPATVEEIAKGISLKSKVKLVEYALNVLVSMGWVIGEITSDQLPASPTKSRVEKSRVIKSNRDYSESFEIFWKKFKGRWNPENDNYIKVGKFEAWEEWQKLNAEDQTKATAVANRVSGKFVPDACRWLKKRLFDDFTVR